MKILVIFPGFHVRGGMKTVVKSFLEKQAENKVEAMYVETYSYKTVLHVLFVFYIAILKALIILLFKKCDLMHIHSASKGSFYRKSLFCLLANTFAIPVVFHMHGGGFKEFYSGVSMLEAKYIRYILNRKIDRLIVLSHTWNTWFNDNFNLKNPPTTLNNSVNIQHHENQGSHISLFNCVYVGRLVKDKGIDDLIQAVYEAEFKDCIHIGFIGDGELDYYKKLTEVLNLQSYITFYGWLPQFESIEKIKCADALILPSYKEGLPMVIIEAMACKTAVVATNVGGIPDVIINEKNGLLFFPGDTYQLKSCLSRLLKKDDFYRDIVDNAYQCYLDDYQLDMIFPQLLNIYASVKKK